MCNQQVLCKCPECNAVLRALDTEMSSQGGSYQWVRRCHQCKATWQFTLPPDVLQILPEEDLLSHAREFGKLLAQGDFRVEEI